jgi:uncharacterized protein (DUF952 family)
VIAPLPRRVAARQRAPRPITLDRIALPRHDTAMLIYKIFRAPEWADLQARGETLGAPIDIADGFVHFSTAAQATETAARHFTHEDNLTLLALDAGPLGEDLRWEPSRGGALFPHLYRPLRLADVLWHRPLPLVDGTHRFPPEMT